MPGPLDGVRVIEFSSVVLGPWACQVLADMGADVVKVEAPYGDSNRQIGAARHEGMAALYLTCNRNKRDIVLDVKQPAARQALLDLCRDADVFVHNNRPQVMTRLGLDYEAIRQVNPRIVYGSISGFGQDGPYRDRPGVDQIAQGLGGLMSITGLPGQGPVRVGIPIADLCSGIFLAQGILVALLDRERTGEGKWVATSLLEAMISMLDFQGSRWTMGHEVAPQAGNNHPTGIPTGVFETQNGHINIAASGNDIYGRFCRAMGREDLTTNERYATSSARFKNRDELNEVLAAETRKKTSEEWIKLLNDAGVPCGPINTIDKTFADEQVQFLEMAQGVNSPTLGDLTILGHPVSVNGKRNPLRNSAPELGHDTEAVLMELGFSKADIEDFEKSGAI